MSKILSIENSLKWSWSFALLALKKSLKYDVVRFKRMVNFELPEDIIKFFDVTLIQNVDTLKLISDNNKNDYKKMIIRVGDMATSKDKYSDQLKRVGAIVATNNELYKKVSGYNKNSYMIPNGCDIELFKPKPHDPYEKVKTFTVGFAGNIYGQGMFYKGYDLYSKAISGMYYVDHLEALFNNNQINHEDMPADFYHKIDCLILPTKGEGCSNVTMEALACGVPVITTKTGYHGEVLEDNVNCLFIDRTITGITDAVSKLINDKELCKTLSNNGREFALHYHNIKNIAVKYDVVIRSILKKSKRNKLENVKIVDKKVVEKNRNKFTTKTK